MTGTADAFDVVFVCTGNRFRSPLAAALFRDAVDGLPVRVSSFGTLDLEPLPVLPAALEEAARLGVDLSEHRSRTIVGERLDRADLVVGFERLHVATAVVDAGARRERAFLLPELIGLLAAVEPPRDGDAIVRARRALELAHAARGRREPSRPDAEVQDPIGKSPRFARQIASRVHELVGALPEALFGARASWLR